MTALVEKLRADIAEKDKRSRAMARALAEMKQEIITKAEKESESVAGGGDTGGQAEARRLEAANLKLEKCQKQLSLAREKEAHSARELKIAKDELARKANALNQV